MPLFHGLMIIIALVTITGGVFSRTTSSMSNTDDILENEVLSDQDEEVEPSLTPTPHTTPSPNPISLSSPTSTPLPSNSPTNNSTSLIYPGATILSQSSDVIILEVSANPSDVSKWYQTALKEKGMNALSTAQTNTNDNFIAKIAGATNQDKYSIEITKAAGEAKVKITINL